MSSPRPPLLAFFGDDFTGSTDALEFLSRAGARTALFLEPPTPAQLARHGELDAIGVAGLTRSLAPEPMAATLRPAFAALKALGVRHVHYKVCSTFDSSPSLGSIGCAIEVGREIFSAAPFVPLLVGAPALGRYCAFGNLFARMGIGSQGAIHRLDRHPSASRHPSTPADESDLRRYLGRQTDLPIALFDLLQVALPLPEAQRALDALRAAESPAIILFDLLDPAHLPTLGALFEAAADDAPLFSVGSSGVEMALGAHWQKTGRLTPPPGWPPLTEAAPLLVLSGSQSPVTAGQLQAAEEAGFALVPLDTVALARDPATDLSPTIAAVRAALAREQSVILHTSRGHDDPRIPATAAAFAENGFTPAAARAETAQRFGQALGNVARAALPETSVRRLVIAGGDTSSFAARALGLESVSMLAPVSPGAPLCRACAPNSPADGLEINFKGGQVGSPDYFEKLKS